MKLILLSVFGCLGSYAALGQDRIFISGVVLDSATRQSLPYTAIQVKGKGNGQSVKEDGSFLVSCVKGDTLIFTRLGYKPLLRPVFFSEGPVRIFLAEDARMLKEVTVYDDYQVAGMEQVKKNLPSDARVKLKNQPIDPATNSVATFGPTVTIGLGGKNKQQKRRNEFSKTEVYRSVVNSAKVKKKIMDLYQIPEDTFYQKLEKFNKAHPEAAYLKNQEEIFTLLVQFFAIK
jgi:hypothetical protein